MKQQTNKNVDLYSSLFTTETVAGTYKLRTVTK